MDLREAGVPLALGDAGASPWHSHTLRVGPHSLTCGLQHVLRTQDTSQCHLQSLHMEKETDLVGGQLQMREEDLKEA